MNSIADQGLVCLREDGRLVYAEQASDESWQLQTHLNANNASSSESLPAKALFCIFQHGDYVCIQSLGAEGRLVVAEQNPRQKHRLSSHASEQALWEICGQTLINVAWQHKELGFGIESVTAIPTTDLVKVETDHHQVVLDLQTRLRRLEQDGGEAGHRWSSDSSSQGSAADRETDELRQQLDATKLELDAVRAEAQTALQEQSQHHAAVIKQLLDERQRLDSALHFIRGMTEEGSHNAMDNEDSGSLEEQEMPAIGIPITRTSSSDAGSPGMQDVAPTPSNWLQSVNGVKDDEETLCGNTACEHENFLAKTTSSRLPLSNTLKNRESWAAKTLRQERRSVESDADKPSGSRLIETSPGTCALVDYHGGYCPEVVNEESLDRIMDVPITARGEEERTLPCLKAEFIEEQTPCAKPRRPQSGGTSAPTSIAKDENTSPQGDWPLGTLSLPCSQSATPSDTTTAARTSIHAGPIKWLSSEDSYEACVVAGPATKSIMALEKGSPQDANLLTQYLASRHSCPPQQGSRLKHMHPSSSGAANSETKKKWRTPKSESKKSSFLNRAPVAEIDLFG